MRCRLITLAADSGAERVRQPRLDGPPCGRKRAAGGVRCSISSLADETIYSRRVHLQKRGRENWLKAGMAYQIRQICGRATGHGGIGDATAALDVAGTTLEAFSSLR